MIVEYCKDGDAVSDFDVDAYVQDKIDNNIEKCKVASSIVIDTFRVFRVKNKIENLTFEFEGEMLEVNKGGKLNRWPNGFCDVCEDQLSQLLWPEGIY